MIAFYCTELLTIFDLAKRVEPILLQKVHDSGSSSDSGGSVQVDGDLEFTCKIFKDPKNMSSDKENTPIVDTDYAYPQ